MPNANCISQFIQHCYENTATNFFCFENFGTPLQCTGGSNQNANDCTPPESDGPGTPPSNSPGGQTEILKPNIDEPILLYISKEKFVKFPPFQNSEDVMTTVQQL